MDVQAATPCRTATPGAGAWSTVLCLLLVGAAASGREAGMKSAPAPLRTAAAPLTSFQPADRAHIWDEARARATQPLPLGGRPLQMGGLLAGSFKRLVGFRSEVYSPSGPHRTLLAILSAAEARCQGPGGAIDLTDVRLVHFVEPPGAPSGGGAPAGQRTEMLTQIMGSSGRLIMTASRGQLNAESSEMLLQGGIQIQILGAGPHGESNFPIGRLKCEAVRWRSWYNPVTGSTETTMYAVSPENAEPDPPVEGEFVISRPGQGSTALRLRARGLVFENSQCDHQVPYPPENPIGVHNVERRRAVFRRDIEVQTDSRPDPPLPPPPGAAHVAPPALPSHTTILCEGPALLDLGTPTRVVEVTVPGEQVLLALRFEFLNGVRLHRVAAPDPEQKLPPGAPPPSPSQTLGACRHLCLQYHPSQLLSVPEYMEALGNVLLESTTTPPPGAAAAPGAPPPAPSTVHLTCDRVYYEKATERIALEGKPVDPFALDTEPDEVRARLPWGRHAWGPVHMTDPRGAVRAQVCLVERSTGALKMPLPGPKHLVLTSAGLELLAQNNPPSPQAPRAPGEKAPPPRPKAPALSLLPPARSDFHISCTGPVRRELVHPPGEARQEVISFSQDAELRQEAKGLDLTGRAARITRDFKTGAPLGAVVQGEVQLALGELRGRMEQLVLDCRYGPAQELTKQLLTLTGTPALRPILWQEGQAVQAQSFVYDGLDGSFRALGGTVACFKLPGEPVTPGGTATGAPPAANTASLMPSFSGGAGGKFYLQCEGGFQFDTPTRTLRASRNVFMRREGLTMLGDNSLLALQDARHPGAGTSSAAPPAKGPGASAPQLKSLDLFGNIELVTDTQLVHCDHLYHDALKNQTRLEMSDTQDQVRIYLRDSSGALSLLRVVRRLDVLEQGTGARQDFTPSGLMEFKPYKSELPLPRGKAFLPPPGLTPLKAPPALPPPKAGPVRPPPAGAPPPSETNAPTPGKER